MVMSRTLVSPRVLAVVVASICALVTFALTATVSRAALPDDRGYEMVTPAENEGAEPYAPLDAVVYGEQDLYTTFPFDAAADGNAVTYAGSPTSGGNGSEGRGLGNQFYVHRNTEGDWTQTNLQPNGYPYPLYWGFSPNLDHAILSSPEPIVPGAPAKYFLDLYDRDNATGSYQPLFTGTPPNRAPGEFGAPFVGSAPYEGSWGSHYAGGSVDSSHLLFEANDALASGAVDPGVGANNLYESVEGHPRTVNLLPNGAAAPNTSFGGPELNSSASLRSSLDFSHVISADGSRIFWTDMSTGTLYVRENGSLTRMIAEGATYMTASVDGSRVLYTEAGDLYEDDLETGIAHDLTPGGEVLGLAGAGEGLEYVYVVAQGALAGGSTAGMSNMYLLHDGRTQFIASLGETYAEDPALFSGGVAIPWETNMGRRTAEATPSGHALVFMSNRNLTGYEKERKVPEVFVYDADSGALSCASCDPNGAAPEGGAKAGILPISGYPTYQLRWISEDGSRVFFESIGALVPQAQNGLMNVYEWERDGSGGCSNASGCISLLSSGSSTRASYFIDASVSGNDVFFMTNSELASADQNEFDDIYDARVGATEATPPPQCTGTGCQGVAASPPIFATPASATYNGVGNFATPSTITKPKAKKKAPSCAKSTKKGKRKRSKAKGAAKKGKSKPVLCKAKKAAKRVRRGTNGRNGR
jgi:hypothetical protein